MGDGKGGGGKDRSPHLTSPHLTSFHFTSLHLNTTSSKPEKKRENELAIGKAKAQSRVFFSLLFLLVWEEWFVF